MFICINSSGFQKWEKSERWMHLSSWHIGIDLRSSKRVRWLDNATFHSLVNSTRMHMAFPASFSIHPNKVSPWQSFVGLYRHTDFWLPYLRGKQCIRGCIPYNGQCRYTRFASSSTCEPPVWIKFCHIVDFSIMGSSNTLEPGRKLLFPKRTPVPLLHRLKHHCTNNPLLTVEN